MGVVAGAAAAGVDVAGAGDGGVRFGYLVGGAAVHCVFVWWWYGWVPSCVGRRWVDRCRYSYGAASRLEQVGVMTSRSGCLK